MWKVLRLNWIAFASSLFFAAAILVVLSRREGLEAVVAVWNSADPTAVCLAAVLMLLVQGISACRVKVITATEALSNIGYLSLLRIQFISQFIAYGSPISALSDLAKAAMLKLRFDLPIGQSIRIILYERICGALGAVVVGLVATLCQLVVPTPQTLINAQFAIWAAGLLGGSAILVIGGFHIRTGIGLVDRAARAVTLLGTLLRRPPVAIALLLVSVGQLTGFALIFIVLAHGLHFPISRIHVALFTPLIFLISSLPIFYQGWGGREAIVMVTIGGVGTVSSAQAVALSIAFGVVVFLSSIPGAVFWIMRPSMRKSVRLEMEQTEPTS
jgi:uncharacterized membrane protein YbhN (UPF0104 family)